MNKECIHQENSFKEKLADVTKKIDTIEEKHNVLEEMNKKSFKKFYTRYNKEREEIKEKNCKGSSFPRESSIRRKTRHFEPKK